MFRTHAEAINSDSCHRVLCRSVTDLIRNSVICYFLLFVAKEFYLDVQILPLPSQKIGECHPDDQKMVNNKSLNGFNLIQFSLTKLLHEQECIPVRCIPSTAVAAGGGVS